MPAGYREKPGIVVHLHVGFFAPGRRQDALHQDMHTRTARGDFGVAGKGGRVGLCPVSDYARGRVAAVVEVDTSEGVIMRKDIANASTTESARVICIPLFEGHRECFDTVDEGTPGLGVCGAGMSERLRVDGDFLKASDFPRLLVEAVSAAPQYPLLAGLGVGGDGGEDPSGWGGLRGW